MPTYNRVATLPRAIDSILAQTIQDIELIIVDDGSADSTHGLLKNYISKDKRITVITQKNQGPAIARNNGVYHASGEYIAFMDSDDACAVNRLEIQFNFLAKNPKYAACALSNLLPITDYYPGIVADVDDKHRSYSGSPFNRVGRFYVLGAHSLMTKESFTKVGGYRSHSAVVEDLDFTLRYSRYYSWASLLDVEGYFYTLPSANTDEGQVNSDILNYPKRILACYISEWCRINNIQDPVEQGKLLDEILAIANRIPIKDRAIIYRNIRYFRHILEVRKRMTNKQSKKYLFSILGNNQLDRWLINFWFKLRG